MAVYRYFWSGRTPAISDFFSKELKIWKLTIPQRLIAPLIIVLLAKVAAAIFIYYSTQITQSGTFWSNPNIVYDWPQNDVLLSPINPVDRWPLTFLGWDSLWYLSILSYGYDFSVQSFTFSPALPFFGWLICFFLHNSLVSITLASLVFGILWIPLFQLLAEEYVGNKAALFASLLFAFSPYVFVFTTVAYCEGLFLFSVLGAWLLFKKGKVFGASVFAVLAPLSKIMGIVVVLPMLYLSFKSKTHKLRNVALSMLPVASLVGWFAYLGFVSGDFLAPVHTTEWNGLYSLGTLVTDGIPRYGVQAILEAPYQIPPIITNLLLPISVVCALVIPPLLFYHAWKIDRSLFIYAFFEYAALLVIGALVSAPRFMSFLFPLWIPIGVALSASKKTMVLAVFGTVISYIIGIYLWVSFLDGQFIA